MGGVDGLEESGEAIGDRIDVARESLVRSDENAVKRWILLAGKRGTVAVVFLLAVTAVFLVLGVFWTSEITRLATESEVVATLLFTFLSGTILLVSVTVSINSVVLSQELTAIGTQRENVEQSLEFRRRTKEITALDISPAQPAEFLLAIIRGVRTHVEDLDSTVRTDDSLLDEQVSALLRDAREQVDNVEAQLQKGKFGTSAVLMAGLDYDYSWQMYVSRRLRAEHGDALTDEQERILDDLEETLKQFTTGREYFKTLYFKRELANLSRWILVVAFPVIVGLSLALLALKANLLPDVSVSGMPTIVLFVTVAYVLGLVPYALFTAYILRLATIAYRTLAAGPFILKSETKRGRIDWEDQTAAEESRT